MQIKKLKLNTVSSFLLQITTIICGFILPKLILEYYSSSANGLINSVQQFFSFITFLELGVGAVVQSSLYKPLSEKNNEKISEIITSADSFFGKLAIMMAVYTVMLIFIYPYIIRKDFDYIYTIVIIVAIGISNFAQYCFGIVNRLLLTADQKSYVCNIIYGVTLLLNMGISCILIINGYSIQFVKIATAFIYILRPIVIHFYVKKHYAINRKVQYDTEPIAQKWNGVAQHIAWIALDSTDNIILTIFSTLADVSIYSIYYMVVYGVKSLFTSMTGGIQSIIGELWAKQDIEKLIYYFSKFEWIIHTGVVLVFGCTGVLIMPFVKIYTQGITDVNYTQPIFAILITMAHAGHCLRLPYHMMILASGHYKQTQSNYIVAACTNLLVSIVGVKLYGLIGVAFGTLIAMMYQTIWMAIYSSKQLLKRDIKIFVKQFLTDALIVLLAGYITYGMIETVENYFLWILLALKISIIWGTISIVVNLLFYRDKLVSLIKKGV